MTPVEPATFSCFGCTISTAGAFNLAGLYSGDSTTSITLNFTAIRAMRRAGTTVRPDRGTDHLVTGGPFAFTRNPLYLAGIMLVLGLGLAFGIAWFLLVGIPAAFAVQKLTIEREERHLEARFGETYLDYARRVRRWI